MPSPHAFFKGEFVPLENAKISVMTHGFLYGTACFEGIRAYWSEEKRQLLAFRMREHYDRLRNSCKILQISLPYSSEELCNITVEMLRRSGFQQDVYIRPIAYKSSEAIGVTLLGLKDDLVIFAVPFGLYLDISKGLKLKVSSWRHLEDNAIPMRAKINGSYVNAALAKSEAIQCGCDEAIFLTQDGHVSEGSGENIFIVKSGKLITPPVTDDILEGITRASVIEIAKKEFGIETVERRIDRTELYTADECFLCGTAAQVSPVAEIDNRTIGDGKIGPITKKIQDLFFEVVKGKIDRYAGWCTPVY